MEYMYIPYILELTQICMNHSDRPHVMRSYRGNYLEFQKIFGPPEPVNSMYTGPRIASLTLWCIKTWNENKMFTYISWFTHTKDTPF